MLNYIIAAVLIYAVLAGTSFKDYYFKKTDIPWVLLVVSGFTVSFLGLFYYNDEKIIFFVLLSKLYVLISSRKI